MTPIPVTRDARVLREAKGFWSGNTVVFNPTDQIVILDPDLTVAGLQCAIDDYLKERAASDIATWLQAQCDNRKMDLCSLLRERSNPLREFFALRRVLAFDRPECISHGQIRWPRCADYLAQLYPDETAKVEGLASLLGQALRGDPKVLRSTATMASAIVVTHLWLLETLAAWRRRNLPIEETLGWLGVSAWAISRERYSTGKTFIECFLARSAALLGALVAAGCSLPEISRTSDVGRCLNFSNACAILLGLLVRGQRVLLPPEKDMNVVMWGDDRFRAFAHDLGLMLKDYADQHGLNKDKPFPFSLLYGKEARRRAQAEKWSPQWMRDQAVPTPWVRFAELGIETSDAGWHTQKKQVAQILEWAWFERRFPSPAHVMPTDLRDPFQPKRMDTFYHFVDNYCKYRKADGEKIRGKWSKWNHAAFTFKRVHNAVALNEAAKALLPQNPFQHLDNPFRIAPRNKTPRGRLPTSLHEAMLAVLLSPDVDGEATFSFVRDELRSEDWFDWQDPKSGSYERVWCPSRAHALALLLLLPMRAKQVRWLDEGLLDTRLWDIDRDAYIENTHPLANWRYPGSRTHLQVYGRSSGVLQPAYDPLLDRNEICIWVSTNKTQMWDPTRKTGYELLWPRGDALGGTDASHGGARWLRLPYDIIAAQRRWLAHYDPHPAPVTFLDDSTDSQSVNKQLADQYPYFTPLFRELAQRYHRSDGTAFHLPVSHNVITRLYHAVAQETERRLRDQGVRVVLTEQSNTTVAYQGRLCSYDLHSLRVAGISRLIELGVPAHIIQEYISGHATLVMVGHYTKHDKDYVRQTLRKAVSQADAMGDFEHVVEDLLQNATQLIITQPQYHDRIPGDLLSSRPWSGWKTVDGGVCPLGGTACDSGMLADVESANGKHVDRWVPVVGGCGNCRFFCTGPAFLLQQAHKLNELMLECRELGEKRRDWSEKLCNLSWHDDGATKTPRNIQMEMREIKSAIEEIERSLEPLILEWYNRFRMIQESIVKLDEWNAFMRERGGSRNPLVLISGASKEEIGEQMQVRLEKAGRFKLVREILRGAQLTGGLEKASRLSKAIMREFIDQILVNGDPRHLLLSIRDDKARNHATFLLAEAFSTLVGDDAVEKALDEGTGLKLNSELLRLAQTVISRARQGRSLESMVPPRLDLIEGGDHE